MDLTLAGKHYRVLSQEDLSPMSTNPQIRHIVDRGNRDVPSEERIEAYSELVDCDWLDYYWGWRNWFEQRSNSLSAPNKSGERKELREWLEVLAMISPLYLAPVFFSAIALLFGRGETCRLIVMLPLWILSFLWLLVFPMNLLWDIWDMWDGKKKLLRRLYVLSLLPTIGTGLLWPIIPFAKLHSIGVVATIFSSVLYLVLILRFVSIFIRYTRSSKYRNLRNSSPSDTLHEFYKLMSLSINRSVDRQIEERDDKASQYLAIFRQSKYIGEADISGCGKWSTGLGTKAKSLYDFANELHFAFIRPIDLHRFGFLGNFGCVQTVYLRAINENESERVYAYSAIDACYVKTHGGERLGPDWYASSYRTYESIRIYDKKILIRFDDGWFIESGKYDQPMDLEIATLRTAGLLS